MSIPTPTRPFALVSPRIPRAAPAAAGRVRQLSDRAAFALQVSIILFFIAGSSAPTPLYTVYQAAWGFSPVTITVVFGVYALAVLAALLVFGSLSDHVGRRPILLATTLIQAVAMAIFATAHGVAALAAARVVQGLATGAAAGAVGAGMLDLDRAKGTIANAVAPMIGTASGALLSGLMVVFLPAPTQLVYLVLAAIFVAQAIGVTAMRESATPRPGALASLKPHFRLPPAVRAPMLLAVPALVAAWALIGFYGSLGPSLVRRLLGSTSPALGGLIYFVLAGSGALAVLLTRERSPRFQTLFATTAMLVGLAAVLPAITHASVGLLFAGTAVAGAGFGCAFQGAVRSVVAQTGPHERAGVLSIVFVVAYLAMGVPAVLAGLRVVHSGGLVTTAHEFVLATMALAALALGGTLVTRGQTRAVSPGVARDSSSTS
ncbi:MAG TPA: MFS transporter [Polyangia bacterium]|jgi:MFS family permease